MMMVRILLQKILYTEKEIHTRMMLIKMMIHTNQKKDRVMGILIIRRRILMQKRIYMENSTIIINKGLADAIPERGGLRVARGGNTYDYVAKRRLACTSPAHAGYDHSAEGTY